MGSSKPKVMQLPFSQQQQQTATYAPYSIGDTQEAKDFLDTPLDFGSDTNVDPGVGRRTDLAEQEVGNRANSAFNAGTPRFIREAQRARELREVQSQGAYETQNAQYLNQQGNNARRSQRTMAELERRRLLLPQVLQTGGTSNASGYNSQLYTPQPGFWQRAALGAIQGAGSTISALRGGG